MKRISLSIAALSIFTAATSFAAAVPAQSTPSSLAAMVTDGSSAVTSGTGNTCLGPSGTTRNPWGAAHFGPSGTTRNPWGAAHFGPSGTTRNPWGAAHFGPSGTTRNPWGA